MSNKTPLYGSFLGFTFNKQHSSTLGITRVNNSNRMVINLLPTLKDSVAQVESDQSYYFGSTYTKREIIIPFAFDDLTEEGISHLKTTFKDNKIHNLILDEEPYKLWSAKFTGSSVLKQLCFEETKENKQVRHYRGEGSYSFTCYFCFARSRFNYREDYVIGNIPEWVDIFKKGGGGSGGSGYIDPESNTFAAMLYYEITEQQEIDDPTLTGRLRGDISQFDWVSPEWLLDVVDIEPIGNGLVLMGADGRSIYINYDEWIEASNLPSKNEYGKWIDNTFLLYNAGDIKMPIRFWFELPENDQDTINIGLLYNDQRIVANNVKRLKSQDNLRDKYVVIDTYKHVLEGYDEQGNVTNHLYNNFLIKEDFFKIGLKEQEIQNIGQTIPNRVEFNYLYL